MRALLTVLSAILILAACSSRTDRGIADKRSNFQKFLPMAGDAAQYGLKPVRPYFKTANREQVLRAIERACVGRKEGSSIYDPATRAGYYVNCNPENRQLLNGYIPSNPKERPHSGRRQP